MDTISTSAAVFEPAYLTEGVLHQGPVGDAPGRLQNQVGIGIAFVVGKLQQNVPLVQLFGASVQHPPQRAWVDLISSLHKHLPYVQEPQCIFSHYNTSVTGKVSFHWIAFANRKLYLCVWLFQLHYLSYTQIRAKTYRKGTCMYRTVIIYIARQISLHLIYFHLPFHTIDIQECLCKILWEKSVWLLFSEHSHS